MSPAEARKKIIQIYKERVHGKVPDTSSSDPRHDGKVGHWLEKQMGVKPNADNAPDLYEYEMKTNINSGLTLGSWDPNYWVFRNETYKISRGGFLKFFGKANLKKGGRMSWSGSPVPKINGTNSFGMRIEVDSSNNIEFVYSFSKDTRSNKSSAVPKNLQVENLIICRWNADGKKSLREKVERKFNQNGWFKCIQDESGAFSSIVFGNPFTFETFISYFKNGDVYFDCGMYEGNDRNYCQWRTRDSFWDSLIVNRHP